ncbi:MAG: 30S ribosomal protein S21 [Silvanigrellaceae bacterium]|nr:30S ribosomal protein S21 [Silvanigrellaceae bacterium]
MPKVIIKPNEKIEYALRRFKKSCDKAKILQDFLKHEFYTPATEARVERKKQAIKREKRRDK